MLFGINRIHQQFPLHSYQIDTNNEPLIPLQTLRSIVSNSYIAVSVFEASLLIQGI